MNRIVAGIGIGCLWVLLAGCTAEPVGSAQAQKPFCPDCPVPETEGKEAAVDETEPVNPFARVYLAMKGCTSCNHCRTTIRQMVKGHSKTQGVVVTGDQVEVRYDRPREIPLAAVIRSLAKSRLHDLELVDVLFEAEGEVEFGLDGTHAFVLKGTGQKFPLALSEKQVSELESKSVLLRAVVGGWREDGTLQLEARSIYQSSAL